jgi:hypothetical protein
LKFKEFEMIEARDKASMLPSGDGEGGNETKTITDESTLRAVGGEVIGLAKMEALPVGSEWLSPTEEAAKRYFEEAGPDGVVHHAV